MRTALLVLTVSAVLAAAPGCVATDGKVSKRGNAIAWKIARKGNDRFALGKSKIKAKDLEDPEADKGGSLIFERAIYPPFRVEACVGAKTDKAIARLEDNGVFGIELDLPGARPPTEFYGVTVRRAAGLMQAFGSTHLSPTAIGDERFPGAMLLYIAVEHDGSTVTFEVRESESDPWTEIGSIAAAGQTFPVYPTLGMFFVAKPGAVQFDDLRIVQNGSPGDLSPLETAEITLLDAGDDALSALYRLEKDTPDRVAAGTDLDDAIAGVTTAVAQVETAIPAKRKKPARDRLLKALDRAIGKLEKARTKLDAGKSPKSVNKQVEAALKLLYRSIPVFDELPQPTK